MCNDFPAFPSSLQFEVRFELDADGILKVTATDLVTDARADIVVENRQSTNSDEVERMIRDAERFKARDDELIRRVSDCVALF